MRDSLWPKISTERRKMLLKLKSSVDLKLVQEDENFLREAKGKFSVAFKGVKILYYHLPHSYYLPHDGFVAIPWHKLIVYSQAEDPKEILQMILGHLGLKCFHDEDAHGGGIFSGTTDYGPKFAYCYINPDYKRGFWDNHTLEVEPRLS